MGAKGAVWCLYETTAYHQNVVVLQEVPITGEEENMAHIFKKGKKEVPGKQKLLSTLLSLPVEGVLGYEAPYSD